MANPTIFHNPRCSKSRETLRILTEKIPGGAFEVREYLKKPPSVDELAALCEKLNLDPTELVRKKEKIITEENIDLSGAEQCLAAMHQYPILMERPIVVKGNKAVIGRPPESVLKLL